MVGNHQGVGTERAQVMRVALMLEPGEQPFFGPQALQEAEVGFVELRAQRAAGEGIVVSHVDAPLRHQAALALVVGKHGFGDVERQQLLTPC